jgi:hypothetical protein
MSLTNTEFSDALMAVMADFHAGTTTEAQAAAALIASLDSWIGVAASNAVLADRFVSLLARLDNILINAGTPPDTLGIDGAYCFDTVNQDFYGPKTGGAWGAATSLSAAAAASATAAAASATAAAASAATATTKATSATGSATTATTKAYEASASASAAASSASAAASSASSAAAAVASALAAGFVNGSVAAPSIKAASDTNTGIYFPAADEWAVSTGGVKRLHVTAAGISVTGSVDASSWGRFTYLNTTITSGIGLDMPGGYVNINDGVDRVSFGISSGAHIGTVGAAPFYLRTAATSRVTILADGRVGIGTTAPVHELEVADASSPTIRINDTGGTSVAVNAWIEGSYGATQAWWVGMSTGSGAMTIANNLAGPMTLQISAAEVARFDTNKNLMLGATGVGTNAVNVIGIADGTAPASSPAGMGQLYVESGALKYRGSSGTITTIANA